MDTKKKLRRPPIPLRDQQLSAVVGETTRPCQKCAVPFSSRGTRQKVCAGCLKRPRPLHNSHAAAVQATAKDRPCLRCDKVFRTSVFKRICRACTEINEQFPPALAGNLHFTGNRRVGSDPWE